MARELTQLQRNQIDAWLHFGADEEDERADDAIVKLTSATGRAICTLNAAWLKSLVDPPPSPAVRAELRGGLSTKLHRRLQLAESAAQVTVDQCKRQGISLARGLAGWAYTKASAERDEARAELERLRAARPRGLTHDDVAMLRAQARSFRKEYGPQIADAFDFDDLAGRIETALVDAALAAPETDTATTQEVDSER